MKNTSRGVVLVGHGGIPTDCPPALITQLKRLEAQRRAAGAPVSVEESDLDRKIRRWPRTPATDPYRAGLERLAAHLKPLLGGVRFSTAYNEFCAPTLAEAIAEHIAAGARDVTVVSTMFTPGGSHSECEIPEDMAALRKQYPGVTLTYAWPFDLGTVAAMLSEHLTRFQTTPAGHAEAAPGG